MWDLFGFPGDIGHGYTVVWAEEEIVVSGPPGARGGDIFVRESSVFVCTLDDQYLFNASRYGEQSSNAKVWRVELEKGRTHEYVLPNDVPAIMEHIHGYSPGVRNREIAFLTGEGQAMSAIATVYGMAALGSVVLAGLLLLVLYLRERRKNGSHRKRGAAVLPN